MSAKNIDLDAIAATLSAAFNNIAADLQQGIQEAQQEEIDAPHARSAQTYVALASIADTLVRVSAEARARQENRSDRRNPALR